MIRENHATQSESGNPYRSPKKSDENDFSRQTSHRRRFRKRLVPATLLWLFSALILFGYLCAIGMVVYMNIQHRLIEPDLEELGYLNQLVLSPPIIAHCIFGIAGALCGIFAASAWMRGNWSRAVVLTGTFLLLMAFVGYIDAGR